MIRLATFTVLLFTLLLSLRVVDASVALCFQTKGPTNAWARDVVGFHIWNDQGDTAAEYRSIYSAGKTTLKNNGWTLSAVFAERSPYIRMKTFTLSSEAYGEIGYIGLLNLCPFGNPDGRIYYGCYQTSNTPDYCRNHREEYSDFCIHNFTMGSDTISCVRQPKPIVTLTLHNG